MAHHATLPAASLDRMRALDAVAGHIAPHRPLAAGPSLGLLFLLIPLIVSGAGVLAMILLIVAGTVLSVPGLVPVAAVCGSAYLAVRHRRPRPVATPTGSVRWADAQQRFRELAAAYADHECDPLAVLRLPALSDVSVPSTARFVDAFAEAQALDTDGFPGEVHAAPFVRAADGAARAWQAARDAAERIGWTGFTPAQRSRADRVVALLALARSTGSDDERRAALARARSELARLDAVSLPRRARDVLDAAARPELGA